MCCVLSLRCVCWDVSSCTRLGTLLSEKELTCCYTPLQFVPCCLVLNLLSGEIPGPNSFAAAAFVAAAKGARELLGFFVKQVLEWEEASQLGVLQSSLLGVGSGKGSAKSGKQPVLAGQSLSTLVKVSEVLPGYLHVDCLKYQHVSLPLCSCTFQLCWTAALLACIWCIRFTGLLGYLSIFGW